MENSIVTALIPTYKRPRLLKRAILSVLNQTYPHVKVSVFDNASSDETEELVIDMKAADDRIQYYCHEENIGALKNFKYAFQSIETQYFSILSDDDILCSDLYANALSVLNKHPSIMFIILDTLVIDENGNLIGNKNSTNKLHLYQEDNRINFYGCNGMETCWTAMVFRKEVAQIYINMDGMGDIASDMRFLKHAAARYPFAYLSRVGAFFTNHPNSKSNSRPWFDILHYATEISRYVEICQDPNINEYVKHKLKLQLARLLRINNKTSFGLYLQVMKKCIKDLCSDSVLDNIAIEREIDNSRLMGYIGISFLISCLYKNKIVKSTVKIFFLRYYNYHIQRQKVEMEKLQEGKYKNLFKEVKKYSQ